METFVVPSPELVSVSAVVSFEATLVFVVSSVRVLVVVVVLVELAAVVLVLPLSSRVTPPHALAVRAVPATRPRMRASIFMVSPVSRVRLSRDRSRRGCLLADRARPDRSRG
jgi:hypothetical protein